MHRIASLSAFFLLTACAHVRDMDAGLYGPPPPPLMQDVTVEVEFDDALSVSVRCGTKAMGPLGALIPVHGCVQAAPNAPVRMLQASAGALRGEVRIVEFLSPDRVEARCARYGRAAPAALGLPSDACLLDVPAEPKARLVWPNPCATGDTPLCHELGHVNQFALGWTDATLSPARHWGRAPQTGAIQLAGSASR